MGACVDALQGKFTAQYTFCTLITCVDVPIQDLFSHLAWLNSLDFFIRKGEDQVHITLVKLLMLL